MYSEEHTTSYPTSYPNTTSDRWPPTKTSGNYSDETTGWLDLKQIENEQDTVDLSDETIDRDEVTEDEYPTTTSTEWYETTMRTTTIRTTTMRSTTIRTTTMRTTTEWFETTTQSGSKSEKQEFQYFGWGTRSHFKDETGKK